jgi:glutathione S-transferase
MFGAKADIALREKGLAHDTVQVNYSETCGYAPKHEVVLRINPKGQVPVLIDGPLELFDSTQIFEYLEDIAPNPAMWPSSIVERAQARQLEMMSDEVYMPDVVKLFSLQSERDGASAQAIYAGLRQYHQSMEKRLTGNSAFLAGTFSYADIAFFMAALFGDRMGSPITAQTPKLLDWRSRIAARTTVQEALKPMQAYLASVSRYFPDWVYSPTR